MVVSILFSLLSIYRFLLCIDKAYHVWIHSSIRWKEKASKSSFSLTYVYVLYTGRWSGKIIVRYALSRFDDLIRREEKKERKRQSCEREGELSHFTFISIHCNRDQQKSMMIDSGYRRQNTNTHETSDPMIIAIRLCTHSILSHNTKVQSGMCGQLNWLCIFLILFYSIEYSFHTSCGT